MPRSAQNELLHEWAKLLKAVRENEDRFPGIAPQVEALQKAYTDARSHRSIRDSLAASTRDATQRLQNSLDEGRDAAISLRSLVKGTLGVRTEELTVYGIKPRRKRRNLVLIRP